MISRRLFGCCAARLADDHKEPQIVRTALHCVMPVAMFNLLAAGSALVVTPGREVALLLGCAAFPWSLTESHVWSALSAMAHVDCISSGSGGGGFPNSIAEMTL